MYLCTGDPSLPPEYFNVTALRWDPSPELCNAGTTGSGTMIVYSLLAPGPDQTYVDAISVKSGLDTYFGNLTGTLPQPHPDGYDGEGRASRRGPAFVVPATRVDQKAPNTNEILAKAPSAS